MEEGNNSTLGASSQGDIKREMEREREREGERERERESIRSRRIK